MHVSADDLASAIRAAQAPVPGQDLTAWEREVLALLVEGLTNTAIAGRCVVSASTAKAHVSSILTKLGVSSRTEAVALAMRHHVVT